MKHPRVAQVVDLEANEAALTAFQANVRNQYNHIEWLETSDPHTLQTLQNEALDRLVLALQRATPNATDWATKGCFTATSTRVSAIKYVRKRHSADETLKSDDHLGPNRTSL